MPFIQQYLPVFLYLSPHLLLSHTTLLHMVNIVQLSIACQVGKLSWISDANRFDCTFTKSQSPSNWMLNRFLKASLLLPPPPHATTCTDSVGNPTELTRQVSLLQQRFVSRHDPLPVLVLLVVVDDDDDDAAGSSEVVVCRCHVGTFRNNQNLTWLLFHSTPSSTASSASPSPSYSPVHLPPSAVPFVQSLSERAQEHLQFGLRLFLLLVLRCRAAVLDSSLLVDPKHPQIFPPNYDGRFDGWFCRLPWGESKRDSTAVIEMLLVGYRNCKIWGERGGANRVQVRLAYVSEFGHLAVLAAIMHSTNQVKHSLSVSRAISCSYFDSPALLFPRLIVVFYLVLLLSVWSGTKVLPATSTTPISVCLFVNLSRE